MIPKDKDYKQQIEREEKGMTNLERLMKDLKTTIGEKQKLGQMRKPRKSTRADGTNPRAKGTNPRVKRITSTETKTVLVENFDSQDWDEILSLEERWGYDYE
jgi:hypothetical protein